ncbi:peptidase M48 [Massilia sp. WF1]|uniref:M48 family metallopeptidase n=1 Tax=unclassified Massilia TaxID=2609279 RepID=UPI0006493EBC|nr:MULTISPECIES: M48 family metallopeptidase [unclassified Massilia]ALK98583.1 peptidase M48 [Massilia sp. WG5]KLU35955.1 peptidase M48 [Massilia sp. WF1]
MSAIRHPAIRLLPAVAAATALLLTGCATQGPQQPAGMPRVVERAPEAPGLSPQMAAAADTLTKMADLQNRLYKVAAPLLIHNAELCKGQARNLLGFTAKNRWSYPGDYNEAAHVAFGMDERLQVTSVLAGSGAAKAGLQTGDILLAAAGKPLPTGQHALSQAGAIFNKIVASQATLPMTVERRDSERHLSIPVTRACAFAIELGNADNVNAYADGSRVLVTRGMINATRNDEELAYVLAKTMAHNMLGHASAQRNVSTIGSIIDNLKSVTPDNSMLIGSGGIKAMPPEMDAAADRLSLYMAARAGYDIDDADNFWKRLNETYPPTVLNGYNANHPALSARLAAIAKAQAEIKAKKSAKKALVP